MLYEAGLRRRIHITQDVQGTRCAAANVTATLFSKSAPHHSHTPTSILNHSFLFYLSRFEVWKVLLSLAKPFELFFVSRNDPIVLLLLFVFFVPITAACVTHITGLGWFPTRLRKPWQLLDPNADKDRHFTMVHIFHCDSAVCLHFDLFHVTKTVHSSTHVIKTHVKIPLDSYFLWCAREKYLSFFVTTWRGVLCEMAFSAFYTTLTV